MMMKHATLLGAALLAGALPLLLGQTTQAQSKTTRSYSVELASVMDNCGAKGRVLSSNSASIIEADGRITLKVAGLPDLTGVSDKRGKLRLFAKEAQSRISANGRESRKSLRLVLIVEQFENERPTCTQSFSIKGTEK